MIVANGIDLAQDSGMGFENADKDSYAIPFLRILQSGSPQCKKSHADYIKGAEEGDFFNTVTKEVTKGDDGVDLIFCVYDRKFTKWAPARGGFRGELLPNDSMIARAVEKLDDEGKRTLVIPDGQGTIISDTRYHFALHVKGPGEFEPVLICMASSGIKVSKRIMTELSNLKITGTGGKKFTPPMFLNKVHMGVVNETKDDNSWANWNPEITGQLDITNEDEADLYMAARAFRDSVVAGKVEVKHSDESEAGTSDKF